MNLKRIVPEAGLIPSGYAPAWRCYNQLAWVCYPWPLNLVLASLRSIWRTARFLIVPDEIGREVARARHEAFAEGRARGFAEGVRRSREGASDVHVAVCDLMLESMRVEREAREASSGT